MPIEIDDGLENEPKPPPKKKKKAQVLEEEEEMVGQKRELWPLIPAIPVVIAIVLSVIPEKPDVNELDVERTRCVAQLRITAAMKESVVKDQDLSEGASLPEDSLQQIRSSAVCPAGGDIDIREVGHEPRCAIHGTVSDWVREGENLGHWYNVISK